MISEEQMVGSIVAGLCLLGLIKRRWLLQNTRKGQRLTRWFGEGGAELFLCVMLIAGAMFGIALVTGAVRPLNPGGP